MRYLVEQEDGCWIITSSRDPGLGWSGQHWCDREQAARLIRFPDRAAAEEYAREVFGGREP